MNPIPPPPIAYMNASTRPLALLFGALLLTGSLSAQVKVEYSDKVEEQFREAVARYDAGAYRNAIMGFDQLIREFPASQRTTAAYVMKGKALYRLNENLDAAKTMKAFLSHYPSSTYIPDAQLILGLVYARIERFEEALDEYLSACRHLSASSPDHLTHQITAAMDSTVDGHIDTPGLQRFLARATHQRERAYLWLKIGEKEAAAENAVAAGIALDTLDERYPGHPYAERTAVVRSKIAVRSSVKLGALLPLMRNSEPSAAKEIGNDVYEGIQYAVESYGRDPRTRIVVSLETRDTEREPKLATSGAQSLVDDKDVVGIIGPVFSTTVTSAASVASARGVPLVTPTANANKIAATGKYIFQANPDYDARGRAMARYAIENRKYRTVAVLAPANTYARFLAEGFIREALSLGARILSTEWYERGTSDLKPQLAKMRRAGMLASADAKLSFGGKMPRATLMKFLDLGVPPKRLDSLMNKGSNISARQLLGPRARIILDSLNLPVVYDESQIDSLQYPVDAIEAIYAPISAPEEIGIVSSQVVYFNFQTQLLGSGEWNSFSELNANRRYSDGVVFESDTHIDTTGGAYASFVSDFVARFKKRPTKNTLFGYDVAALVLSLIANGATTRDAVQRALVGVRDFQGLHSKIGFGPERVNNWLTIFRYEKDEIRKVDEIYAEHQPEGGGNEETIRK